MKTFQQVDLHLFSYAAIHSKHLWVLSRKIDAEGKAAERWDQKQRPVKSKNPIKIISRNYAHGGSIATSAAGEKNVTYPYLSIMNKISKIYH